MAQAGHARRIAQIRIAPDAFASFDDAAMLSESMYRQGADAEIF